MAANDGASGVAVMLEIARQLQADKKLNPSIGVDFVCFDTEDWGVPQWSDAQDDGNSWALGAQYWSENKPEGYNPRYGILLDMVGGRGAKFYREGMSMQYAGGIVKRVWAAARQAGYGSFFPKSDGGMITDDHIPVNEKAKIPTIDVIAYYPDCQQSSFGPTWHTVNDDMAHLDKNVLKAVGQTIDPGALHRGIKRNALEEKAVTSRGISFFIRRNLRSASLNVCSKLLNVHSTTSERTFKDL